MSASDESKRAQKKRRVVEDEVNDDKEQSPVPKGKKVARTINEPSNHEEDAENLHFEDPFEDEFDSDDDPEKIMAAAEADGNADVDVIGDADDPDEPVKTVWHPRDGLADGEYLDYDPTAYKMMHAMEVEWPCLSFQFLSDNLGFNRTKFPHTMYAIAGSQADRAHKNRLYIMKMSDLCSTHAHDDDEEEEDDGGQADMEEKEDSAEDDIEDDPILEHRTIKHSGGVNRLRCMPQQSTIVATWAEEGEVRIFDISEPFKALDKPPRGGALPDTEPVFVFRGHAAEGFALDWSSVSPGRLLTGDCSQFIYLWEPESGGWNVNRTPFNGHTASVEDIQWSPKQSEVFASCSVDRTIRIWDARAQAAPVITVMAHAADVNVLSWNSQVDHLLASGSDDGTFSVWDLRSWESGVNPQPAQTFKQHDGPITSIEWHPTESSALAVAGADNQITLWDMSLEADPEAIMQNDGVRLLHDVPPQLMFVHMGQTDIKELHWHPQIPGVIMSTALDGFNIFRAENF